MSYFVALPDWSCITIDGPEAVEFLQNQITNSVKACAKAAPGAIAAGNQVKFAGYCNPKGRLMANFWFSRWMIMQDSQPTERIQLLLSKDITEVVAKRLSMFVLRQKAKVQAQTLMQISAFCTSDGDITALNEYLHHNPDSSAIRLPDVKDGSQNYQRYLIAGNCPQAQSDAVNTLHWHYLEVISAYPRIVHATYEAFVPQMVNMESIQGIDFQKGCYPGQEIVARSQYRGTIKRRLYLAKARTSDLPLPGTEIFAANDPEQPCGLVVLASLDPGQSDWVYLQIECKTELARQAIHLGSSTGTQLEFLSLPYPLIEI